MVEHDHEISAVFGLQGGDLLEVDIDLADELFEDVDLLLVLAHLLLDIARVLGLLEHGGAYGSELLDLLVVLRVEHLRLCMELLPLSLGLGAVSLGIDCLVLVVRFHRVALLILVLVDHAEHA